MFQTTEASDNLLAKWDHLIDRSINGTIFHMRQFLSYHGDKFKGREKFLMVLDGTNPVAQISLAIEKREAKSPYGASYGGFVFSRQLAYSEGKELVQSFIGYLRKHKIDRFIMTMPIACCSEFSLDTLYFNLLEAGFKSINRDISSVVCFDSARPISEQVSKRARNMARKAENNHLEIRHGNIADFYQVLESTYQKHGVPPTHSQAELRKLIDLLPERIAVEVAYQKEKPVAGICNFIINKRVNSSFYFCQNPKYQHLQGLSLLILKSLENSQKQGFQYFDFGTSSVKMVARENVFLFKESYTKTGFFRETFQWKK